MLNPISCKAAAAPTYDHFSCQACSRRLYNWLKVAPYQAEQLLDDDYVDDDSSNGVRVLGIAYSPEKSVMMSQ